MNKDVIVGCLYRHFKGALYRVEDIAINSETDKFMVVYRGLNGGMAWVRPFDMFCENVEVDGKTVPRFELVEAEGAEW